MKEHILTLITAILAGMVVMVIHELPKSILYSMETRKENPKSRREIWRLFQYVDPIGLILFVATSAGFSKPYMYRIKEKRTNLILGIAGFFSLAVLFILSMILLKFYYFKGFSLSYTTDVDFFLKAFPLYFVKNIAIFSVNMFLVNLFPLSTFDLGLIVAGKSPDKYFSIIRNDYIIKMVLLLVILFNIIPRLGVMAANAVLLL